MIYRMQGRSWYSPWYRKECGCQGLRKCTEKSVHLYSRYGNRTVWLVVRSREIISSGSHKQLNLQNKNIWTLGLEYLDSVLCSFLSISKTIMQQATAHINIRFKKKQFKLIALPIHMTLYFCQMDCAKIMSRQLVVRRFLKKFSASLLLLRT